MQVGSLEETITVSGAAPVVDTQSMRQQETLNTQRARGAAERQHRSPDAGVRHARLCGDAGRRRRHARYLVGAGQLHLLPRQDRHPRRLRRLPQSVLHRRRVRRRLHHRQRQHPGTAARDERHGRRIGFRQHLAERDPEERQQHVRRRPRRLLLERRDAGREHRRQPERLGAGQSHAARTAASRPPRSSTRSTAWAGSSADPIKQDKIWFFAAIARWGSTVQQPSAFYNPLQGKANIPGKGVVGPTPTLFYPGQPGTPYANIGYADLLGRDQAGVQLRLVSQQFGPHRPCR